MMVEGGGKPPNKLSGIDPFLYQLKTENMIKRGLRDWLSLSLYLLFTEENYIINTERYNEEYQEVQEKSYI